MGINEILTGCLVIITAFYAWFTFLILRANRRVIDVMKEQNESLYRPYIVIRTFLMPKNPLVYLSISNIGKTSARKVVFKIDKNFYQNGVKDEKSNITNLSIFNNTTDCLPPDDEITFLLAPGFIIFGKDSNPEIMPHVFNISASYSFGDKRVTETTTIDLRKYLGSLTNTDPLIDQLDGIKQGIINIKDILKK